ncbi:NAD-dependent epimerase/dehydratase family protein [Phycicoccus flavus]|uniref:NAD-dependent epimerase/dehydratase family protein n=1 Tax=Phycicoccus flavus TaxID=2502783 RepID=UPI000FEBEE30|nr:NAD(P)-dependent oxidoreductase [Phycicoccus flavus]NHA68781.1 NAD(P)-dependent oxidoreductase [Phycicoccus flavus]
MRVLVTGGAGFIGQHLARRLHAGGHDVLALDSLLPQVHADAGAARAAFPGPVVVGDVADPAAWAALPEGTVDAVVHLAAETGTGQSMYEVERYHRVNVEGTRLAARWAREHGAALVSLSSRAVYGEGGYTCPEHGSTFGPRCCRHGQPVASTEDDPHRPVSVYGETKSLAEQAAADEGEGVVPLTVIRPQNVVGPGQALHNPYTGVLAAFLAMLREGRPLTVYGDGHQTRDVVHVEDLVALVAWALDRPPAPGEARVVNCGSGVRTTLVGLAEAAAAGAPVPSPGVTHLDVHRAGDIEHACADLTRLRSLGAPPPRWSAADAVADFVRRSWQQPGADAAAWDDALDELARRGLTS